jgi:TRAP-type C4-dicarboxylate transport system substrate-binding protein
MSIRKFAAALMAVALMPAASRAEPAKLIFATASSPDNALVHKVFRPWAAEVTAASGGALDIEVRDGVAIANATNYYDRVMNDVVQMAFGMQGVIGGRFPLSAAAGLPYVVDDAITASVAYWRLYKSGIMEKEYADLRPVMLAVLPQSRLHFVKVPNSIEETIGTKLISAGKERSEVVRRLGYSPLTAPTADMYGMLQRNVAGGVVAAWPSFDAFKLAEVTSYHLDVPLGGATSIVFLTAKRFAALPERAQKAIDQYANEKQSRQFGTAWEEMANEARAATQKLPGHVFARLDPQTAERWKRAAEPVLDEWAQANPSGKAVLAKFRELLADVQAGR